MSNSLDPSSSHIIPDLNSNDGKVMLAALISLIVVLSFVLLLHVYARWFLAQPQHYHHRRRRRRRITQSGPQSNVSTITHLQNHNLHSLVYHEEDVHTGFGADGLDVSAIASLPLFIYKSDAHKDGLECAICLSVFEDDEIGRLLPKCQHSFHVECIDMWLQWRSNCPICRAPVASSEALREVSISVSVSVSVNNNQADLQDYSFGNISNIVESADTEQLHESCPLEVQIEMPNDSNLECEVHKHSAAAAAAAAASPPPQIGCSLKRMLSMNRSEHWVFPSSSVSSWNNI